MKKFQCRRCGNCCKWHGLVRLTDDEIDAIAAFLNMNVSDFIAQYTILTPDRRGLSLTERENGECCFYDSESSLCIIQQVKPVQCKNFPQLWNFDGWEKECEGALFLNGRKD